MRRSIFFLVLAAVVLSGCNEKDKVSSPTGDPVVNGFEKYEHEIEIASYYLVYSGNNVDSGRSFSETFYAVFNLSVHNNGTDRAHFRPGDLHLNGEGVFCPSMIRDYSFGHLNVREDLKDERIFDNDTVLLPGQTINGSVILELEDYDALSDRSFSIQYNTSYITSASFEKSLAALSEAELFNYAEAFGIPPYNDIDNDLFDPGPGYYYWPNWVNRSVFEYYRRTGASGLSWFNTPFSEVSYFIKVVPGRNITLLPGKRLSVVDDTGTELMNRSDLEGLAIRSGAYHIDMRKVPRIHLSNATFVRFSLSTRYGWGMDMRLSYNNQDIILDEDQTIILARYDKGHFVS